MKTNIPFSVSEPSETEIQHAAYLLWLENGRPEGRDLDHWLAAKELLCHRHARSAKPTRRRNQPSLSSAKPTGRN
jgi:hypothetical protein